MLDYSVSLCPGWLLHYLVLDLEAKILEYINITNITLQQLIYSLILFPVFLQVM